MVSSADLQLLILALLEERSRHGYDLIKAIDERSAGAYLPSPGMVYPALSYLDELGHVSAGHEGLKKQYSLTAAGLVALDAGRERVARLFDELQRAGERLAQELVGQGLAAGEGAAAPGSGAAALAVARRELKATLFDGFDAVDEEQRRVAGILLRTIAEIRKQ
jgi:DNA-binding PadR family transcriptional regulator